MGRKWGGHRVEQNLKPLTVTESPGHGQGRSCEERTVDQEPQEGASEAQPLCPPLLLLGTFLSPKPETRQQDTVDAKQAGKP